MKIPDKVKVGGLEYRVVTTDILKKGESYAGEIDYMGCEIRLKPHESKQSQYQTFLHELCHALYVHCGYYDHDEREIESLSQALAMVIRDNPGLLGGGDNANPTCGKGIGISDEDLQYLMNRVAGAYKNYINLAGDIDAAKTS